MVTGDEDPEDPILTSVTPPLTYNVPGTQITLHGQKLETVIGLEVNGLVYPLTFLRLIPLHPLLLLIPRLLTYLNLFIAQLSFYHLTESGFCGDGRGNDCDGAVDPADTNCFAPSPPNSQDSGNIAKNTDQKVFQQQESPRQSSLSQTVRKENNRDIYFWRTFLLIGVGILILAAWNISTRRRL